MGTGTEMQSRRWWRWLTSQGLFIAVMTACAVLYGRAAQLSPAPFSAGLEAVAQEQPPEGNSAARAVADHLARRYRVASDVIEGLVDAAYLAGHKFGLDPLLILSVIAIESRFNPIAQSEFGAKGLMQVMPEHHQGRMKAMGVASILDPASNIRIGASILRDCIRRAGGVRGGLQLYAGAFGDPDAAYAQKVMAERSRIEQALRRFSQQATAPVRSPVPAI